MAETTIGTSNNLTKKLWDEKLFRDIAKNSFFAKFRSKDGKSIVHEKMDLEKQKGDKQWYGIRMRLAGAGVNTEVLEGNEEALTLYNSSVTLQRYRHAVVTKGDLDRRRTAFDLDQEARAALETWGTEKIDSLCFDAILASPTKVFYLDSSGVFQGTTSTSTAKSGLHATNSKLTPGFISALRTWAKTGGGRAYVPLNPVMIDGKGYFVLLTHPDCLYDLKQNATFHAAMKDAQERGPKNPIFQDAVAIWDNVVIHEHENCTIAADAGGSSNVPWAKSVFMGAQALLWAWGSRPKMVEQTKDYEEQHGFAWAITAGVAKPVFNSLDFGSLGVYLARTNVSGE